MADFEGDDQVKSLIFQSTRKNWKILLKWGVHQFLTKSHFQDMTFSLIFSRFMHFLTKNGWLWAWFWNLDFSIFLPLMEIYRPWLNWEGRSASEKIEFMTKDVFPHFLPFLPLFCYKWLILRVILNSRVFNIPIYNRNLPILVKKRDQSASDDATFPRYGIFPIFSHFSHFLAKNGWFWGWKWSREFSIF